MAEGTLTQKLIEKHLVAGNTEPGHEIAIRIDQTLTQDATGTLVMLELEAMGLDRVRTQVSAQYVDHNLLQQDYKNPDDHLFLRSAARRFGLWFAKPGTGVSHPVHMTRLGKPGATLLGSDSHTCAAGSLGMLAIGAGGLEVALAMAGHPFYFTMPRVWGVRLEGQLPAWVSAKDVILEMLRRHGVRGGAGRVVEYHGPGVATLSAMDRHVIANMGAELGATTTVFPSDENTQRFLRLAGRERDYVPLGADPGAHYDVEDTIALDRLEPLIAKPSSPGNVVPVREVERQPLYQAYVGSSANPGFRDFAVAAQMVKGRKVADHVSFDVNPTSREILENLVRTGHLAHLLHAGARLHQAGCNGCIGMGQAPATGRNSLRTVPRNFPGRSGTPEDAVFLCSPETATASALAGEIADPRRVARELGIEPDEVREPDDWDADPSALEPPLDPEQAASAELVKGPNITSLPEIDPIADDLSLPVLLKMGDDVSTDEILPAGTEVLPYRSNIPKIAQFAFSRVDSGYHDWAKARPGGHAVVARENYGQGSSREHAALAPRYLGLQVVVAQSFSRIHRQNLVNFGVLPLTFEDPSDYDSLKRGDVIELKGVRAAIRRNEPLVAELGNHRRSIRLRHGLTERQADVLNAGGLVNWVRNQ